MATLLYGVLKGTVKFTPGNGIHDIHMNQGNDKRHAADDGVFQDGCLIFEYPDTKYRAFFMAFQSQSFTTDDKTGHAVSVGASGTASVRQSGKPRKKPPRKSPGKVR